MSYKKTCYFERSCLLRIKKRLTGVTGLLYIPNNNLSTKNKWWTSHDNLGDHIFVKNLKNVHLIVL
jgi:hypothetical protein